MLRGMGSDLFSVIDISGLVILTRTGSRATVA